MVVRPASKPAHTALVSGYTIKRDEIVIQPGQANITRNWKELR